MRLYPEAAPGTYVATGRARARRSTRSGEFGRTLIAPTSGDLYAGPGADAVSTLDGRQLVMTRLCDGHSYGQGATKGGVHVQLLVDDFDDLIDGNPAPAWTQAYTAGGVLDPREPALWRVPNRRRIYRAWYEVDASNASQGLYISANDADGDPNAWQVKRRVIGTNADPWVMNSPPRQHPTDGTWYWPVRNKTGTKWDCHLLTLAAGHDPYDDATTWAVGQMVYSQIGTSAGEWDCIWWPEAALWLAAFRQNDDATQSQFKTSADRTTWAAAQSFLLAAPLAAPNTGNVPYVLNGWPYFVHDVDGAMLMFSRSAGHGQRMLRCVDHTAATSPSSWVEPTALSSNGLDNAASTAGGLRPKRVAGELIGAYYADPGDGTSQTRLGRLAEYPLRSGHGRNQGPSSGVGPFTNSFTSSTTTGFTKGAWFTMMTVQVRSKGEWFDLRASVIQQAVTAAATFSADIVIDGAAAAAGNYSNVAGMTGATTSPTIRPFVDRRYLDPGLHTVSLIVRVDNVTGDQSFTNAELFATPVA